MRIESVSNGAVLSYEDYGEDGKLFKEKTVFRFDTDPEGDWDGLIDLLWQISELLGVTGSKYDKQRLSISIVHGNQYICKDKNCKICKRED